MDFSCPSARTIKKNRRVSYLTWPGEPRPPITDVDLRARIRELIASGVLPHGPPPIVRMAPRSTPASSTSNVLIAGKLHDLLRGC